MVPVPTWPVICDEAGNAETTVLAHLLAAHLERRVRLNRVHDRRAFGNRGERWLFVEHHHVELRAAVHAGNRALDGLLVGIFFKLNTFCQHFSHAVFAQVYVQNLARFDASNVRWTGGTAAAVEVFKNGAGVMEGLKLGDISHTELLAQEPIIAPE
jgi:hypothetical protein